MIALDPEPVTLGRTRKFTVDEVMLMLREGILGANEPLELLEGELITVSPQSSFHASLTAHLRRLLEPLYGHKFHVRDHSPVIASLHSLPEPDVALVRGQPMDYFERTPTAADTPLVAEISYKRRSVDRKKSKIYAAGGFATYWIIDLDARRVEVRSSPENGDYQTLQVVGPSEEVSLPELGKKLSAATILPQPK